MKLSVIIPTYNEEEKIARTLDGLMGIKNIEIIVSDGGSEDQTREICRWYPVKVVKGTKGRGKQLNAGAREAQGEVLLFIHADSIVEGRVYRDIAKALKNNFKWGCCTIVFDKQSLFFYVLALASRLRARIFSSCYGDQGIFCEREFFFEHGGFPDLPLMEDLALSHQFRSHCRAGILPARIITSSRRFTQGGPFKTLFLIQKLKLFYFLGVPAERLSEMYSRGG